MADDELYKAKEEIIKLEEKIKILEKPIKIHQYNQLKSDVRDEDKLIWGTPIVVSGITAVVLATAFSEQFQNIDLFIKTAILFGGFFINLALLIGLCKHRFFQVYRNRLIDVLEIELNLIKENKSTKDVLKDLEFKKPNGIFHKRGAYRWLLSSHILMVSLLTGAITFVISEFIELSILVIVISTAVLAFLSITNKKF